MSRPFHKRYNAAGTGRFAGRNPNKRTKDSLGKPIDSKGYQNRKGGLVPEIHIPREKPQVGDPAFKAAEQRLEGARKMALQSPYLRRNYETARKNFIQFLERTIKEKFSGHWREEVSEEEKELRGKLQKLQMEIEKENQQKIS